MVTIPPPRYLDDTYFLCTAKPGLVYSTSRKGWFTAATDADYLAWSAADPNRVAPTYTTTDELLAAILDSVPDAWPPSRKMWVALVADLKGFKANGGTPAQALGTQLIAMVDAALAAHPMA